MAKFLSHDGIDNTGVRAQVMVQTGTGRIKEINGRGRPNENGEFRNVEVVFDPDNPLLKRKVYALLDTTAKELWEFVQAAHADQRDISFRIESQRKRGVDRAKSFEDLVHTEEVVRVLAALDNVFSHEAKTNPKEDPSGENPSALDQPDFVPAAAGSAGGGHDKGTVLAALAQARQVALSETVIDTLVAHALAAGATISEVSLAGYDEGNPDTTPETVSRAVAGEERPWMSHNSDGRVNAGSYMVAHAATAEQFALDHLIELYSAGKKSPVDVSDKMIAQASSVALTILNLADMVQVSVTSGRANRQKNSYGRALSLVIDGVAKRYPVPLGGNEQEQSEWSAHIVAEASERLYGVMEVAQGREPLPESERNQPALIEKPEVVAAEVTPVDAPHVKPAEPVGVDVVAEAFGVTPVTTVSFQRPKNAVEFGNPDFVAPDDVLVGRVRALCEAAGVAGDPQAVSDWLERTLGARATRRVDATLLAAFLTHYEALGSDIVADEVKASRAVLV